MTSVVLLGSLNAPAAQLFFDNFSSTNTSLWGYSNTSGAALSITNGNLFPRTTSTGANQRALVASVSNNFDFFTTPMSITLDVTSVSGGNAGGTNVFADRYVMITTGGGNERNYINGLAGASVFASIARNGGTNLLQVGMIGTNGNFYTSQTAYTGDVTQMVVTFNSTGYSIAGSGTNGFSLSGGDITALWGSNIQFIAPTNWTANGFRLTTGVSNRGIQETNNTARYNQIEVNSLPYTINSNNITFNPATNESVSYNWSITGSNSLIVNGAGTVTVGASNSFSNGTTVNGSTLVLGNANALGRGAVTVSNGALDAGSYTITNSVTNAGGTVSSTGRLGNVTASAGTTSLGGSSNAVAAISGTATVNVTGADTTVAAMTGGTLSIDASSAVLTNYTGGDIGISNSRTLNVLSGSSSGIVSGAGSLTKSGSGTLTLSGVNTYGGATTISNGTISVSLLADAGSNSGIGTNATVTFAGANATNTVLNYTGGTVATDRTFAFNGTASSGQGGTINMASSNTVITATGAASGTGKMIIGEGILVLSNTGTPNSFAPAAIQVDGGATLQLAAADQIGNSTGLILNGGTFRTGTSTAGYSDTLGTLTLSASSTIDLGSAAGLRTLTFANSSAITWTGTLTITNWQGIAGGTSQVTKLLFGTDGLNETQLGQIYFASQTTTGGRLLGSDGELVPIPEPHVYAAAIALLAVVGWRERKRLRSLFRKS